MAKQMFSACEISHYSKCVTPHLIETPANRICTFFFFAFFNFKCFYYFFNTNCNGNTASVELNIVSVLYLHIQTQCAPTG